MRISIISSLDYFLTLCQGQHSFGVQHYQGTPYKVGRKMERKFHTQFCRVEPEVCIIELSRVTQRKGETVDLFISRFKKMRNRCKIHLPDT